MSKQISCASGKTGKALSQNNVVLDTITQGFRFSSGNAGIVQRRVIKYLLDSYGDGFDRLKPTDRLVVAGTRAIRDVSKPFLNPLEYISKLRQLNGDDCLHSVDVEDARINPKGKSPAYYYIPSGLRSKWWVAIND